MRLDLGYLEEMFGGYGGEILYRPFNKNIEYGLSLHKVKQRDYDQMFGFRDYETTTGHLGLYYDYSDTIQATFLAGKYLAGDVGITMDLSRRFQTGFTLGIFATKTNLFVKLAGKKCKVCCTRKTIPNLRVIQKYAVKLGGGTNHRFNLSDEFLIKDNHIASSNIKELVSLAIKNNRGKKITVEVDNLDQLKKIIGLKFNTVLFDNMNIKNLKEGVKIAKNYYETEASGNINLKTIKSIALTGVDRVSIGSITHSAPAVDLKLEF